MGRNLRVSRSDAVGNQGVRTVKSPRRELLATIERLQSELRDAKRSVRAVRQGKADGLVVAGRRGGKVLTAVGADQPYRVLIQSMREGVAILTAEGLVAYANDALAELFGQARDKVLGQPVKNFLHPEAADPFSELLRRAARRRAAEEFRFERKDGSVLVTDFFLSPSKEFGSGFCLVVTDVTEARRYRDALQESKSSLHESRRWLDIAQDAAGVGTWGCNVSTGRLVWSDQNYRLYGMSPGDGNMTLPRWLHRIDPAYRDMVVRRILAGMVTDNPFSMEFRIVWPDGQVRWVNAYGRLVTDRPDGVPWLLGASQDITEFREAEERRRTSEARYRMVFDRAPLGINVTDIDGRFIHVNPAFCRIVGHPEAELIGKSFTEMVLPEDLNNIESLRQQVLSGEIDDFELERAYIRKDKTITWARVYAALLDRNDKPVQVITLVEDISRQRRSAHEIKEMTASLQQLSRRLLHLQDQERRRIARELHDGMGQSLSALKINLERMRQNRVLPEAVDALAEESIHLSDQVCREIRSLSYLLHPPLLDELGLSSALATYIRGFSERTGISVRLSLSDDFGRLASDLETALFRIVQEGLANIHRHSGSATAEIRLRREGNQVVLELRDYGCGLQPAAGSSPTSSGVGLAGIRERTSQLGGKFELKAETPGMSLRVVLPAGVEEA